MEIHKGTTGPFVILRVSTCPSRPWLANNVTLHGRKRERKRKKKISDPRDKEKDDSSEWETERERERARRVLGVLEVIRGRGIYGISSCASKWEPRVICVPSYASLAIHADHNEWPNRVQQFAAFFFFFFFFLLHLTVWYHWIEIIKK